jgi:hypothetical protein
MVCMFRPIIRFLFLYFLCAGLISAQTSRNKPSFEAFRLKSGMTPDEVTKQFPNYELRWLAQPKGAATLVQRPVDPDNPNIYASVSFCHNQLRFLSRELDADTDFLGYVQDYIREYGQPKVSVEKQPWTGSHGGDITTLKLQWLNDGVFRSVSLVPEGRTGTGELRYSRSAYIAISFSTKCE